MSWVLEVIPSYVKFHFQIHHIFSLINRANNSFIFLHHHYNPLLIHIINRHSTKNNHHSYFTTTLQPPYKKSFNTHLITSRSHLNLSIPLKKNRRRKYFITFGGKVSITWMQEQRKEKQRNATHPIGGRSSCRVGFNRGPCTTPIGHMSCGTKPPF